MLVRALFYTLRTGPRVQRASGIPCALFLSRAASFPAKLARNARRDREVMFFRHCERSDLSDEALAKAETIHAATQRKSGLLRRLRSRAQTLCVCRRQ